MTRSFRSPSPLVLLALATVAVALFVVATLGDIALPAPGEASKEQAEEIYEQLIAAIRDGERKQANRLARWLDDRLAAQGQTTPLSHSRIVELWCEMGGYQYTFCEEVDNAKE